MIIIIDNHNHDNGNHNNDITMIIMLTVTTVTRREYFQIDICFIICSACIVSTPEVTSLEDVDTDDVVIFCCCLIKMTQLKALFFMTIVLPGEYPNAHEN